MIRLLFALSLGLMLFAAAGNADTLKDGVPNLSVIGEAYEDVAPDLAILRFGVVTERPLAADAAAENARAVEAVLAELKKLGVPDAEVQTQGVTLAPVTVEERDPKTGKPKTSQKFFRARSDLTVRVTQRASKALISKSRIPGSGLTHCGAKRSRMRSGRRRSMRRRPDCGCPA